MNQCRHAQEEAKLPVPEELHNLLKNQRDEIDKLIKEIETVNLKVNHMEGSMIKQQIAQLKSMAKHLEVLRQEWPRQLAQIA